MYQFLAAIAIYIWVAYCLMVVARKTNTTKDWYAWVLIVNYYLMTKIVKKPWWWVILLLIPIVNIIASLIIFVEISKLLKKPWWIGIVMVVPFANLVGWGYLAFSEEIEVKLKN
ncbi:MAG: hypothetical protein CMI54_01090 [Parcubacteria group bacterium]|nr:hypothetical protein [Parcubacteria group bacterium]|tara:strand:+ start:34328 stop:34669 length:342 start_codon:yes stop_codon:yes gene_type:complete